MINKPKTEQILATYSQEEILELLKMKVVQDATNYIENFQRNLSNMTNVFRGSPLPDLINPAAGYQRTETAPTGKRRGRPARHTAQEGSEASEGTKQNLGELILQVLGEEPMKIPEILEGVQNLGWQSKSNNPRLIISQELARQVKSGSIEKVERGSYKKA